VRAPRLTRDDRRGALAVFPPATLSTVPVALPFPPLADAERALRASNAVAVTMLLVGGISFGRAAGLRPWPSGLLMVVLGVVLVASTIARGGWRTQSGSRDRAWPRVPQASAHTGGGPMGGQLPPGRSLPPSHRRGKSGAEGRCGGP
jgi:hypothetical protein